MANKYTKPGMGSAADMLDQGGASAPATPPEAGQEDASTDQPEAGRDDTFFLPATFPGADGLAKGDTVTLRVVGSNDQGELEVENVSDEGGDGGGGPPWKADLQQTMA